MPEKQKPKQKPKPKRVVYRCGKCGRRLRAERWVYSRFTGNRYCWPGEGCAR